MKPQNEIPTSVTIRLNDGRNEVVNLSPSFSLDKANMHNDKVRGYDTLSQRLQELEHDFNGPTLGGNRLAQVVKVTLVSTPAQIAEDFGPGFLKSTVRSHEDYSK